MSNRGEKGCVRSKTATRRETARQQGSSYDFIMVIFRYPAKILRRAGRVGNSKRADVSLASERIKSNLCIQLCVLHPRSVLVGATMTRRQSSAVQ
jgi:hypothetical protein